MRNRIGFGLAAVAAGLAVLAGGPNPTPAQDKKDAAPKWVDSYDLISRSGARMVPSTSPPPVIVSAFSEPTR